MYIFRDWRVLTWLTLVCLLAAVLAFAYGMGGQASVAVPLKQSQAQTFVAQIDSSVYQGVSAGSDRESLATWLGQVSLLASQGLGVRATETSDPSDALNRGFSRVQNAAQYGLVNVSKPGIQASSIRRNVVAAINELDALAKGRTWAPTYNQLNATPTTRPVATPAQVPPTPGSDGWPFTLEERP